MRLRIWSLYKIKRRPSFLGVVCSPTSLQVSKFGSSVALSLPGCTAWPLPCERTMCCSPPGLDVHLPWKGFFSPQPLALLAWTLSLASFGWWFTRTRSISAGTETELLRWPTLLSFHFRATFHLLLLTCKGTLLPGGYSHCTRLREELSLLHPFWRLHGLSPPSQWIIEWFWSQPFFFCISSGGWGWESLLYRFHLFI